jgi:mRNA interferase RelE/StbE
MFVPSASKELKKLESIQQTHLNVAIDALADNPRPLGAIKMKGSPSSYRIRVGDYRIIYRIEDDVLLITVIKVAHRREVYR